MLAPGAAAPDISGTNINPKAPDITYSLATLSGKVVVVIFFAWWCPHCVNELGILQNLWKKYQGHEVGFVAVHTESDDAHARQFGYPNALSAATSKLTALGIQFPAVQDDTVNTIFSHYDGLGYGFPQVCILDKDHVIHSVVSGEEPESATDNRISLLPLEPRAIVILNLYQWGFCGPVSGQSFKTLSHRNLYPEFRDHEAAVKDLFS
ncbi:MAG TPA: TlpA disulfide reductase family protein [Methanoregula sp.]|nr:TlpA disulfide reductase family protein [Methanoregula sp.]